MRKKIRAILTIILFVLLALTFYMMLNSNNNLKNSKKLDNSLNNIKNSDMSTINFIKNKTPLPTVTKDTNHRNIFSYSESFENAKSKPNNLVNSLRQGIGGDGVYAIASYGTSYENRKVYIEDKIVYSGAKALKHHAIRENSVGSYTGTEALISPGKGNYDANEDDEMWARMMIYIPKNNDWRTGEDGKYSISEPKIFRVYWRSDRWLTTYLIVSKGGYSEPTWYKNKYPTGIAVGIRYEIDHDNGPGPINYGTATPWTINGSKSNFTYVAPKDNNYSNFIIPYDKWVSLEFYTYFNSNPSKGISRFWLNETLVYEQHIDTWTSQKRNAPFEVVSIISNATWQGNPTTETIYYTDNYTITNDPSKASKTDKFGNKMLGK